MPTEQRATVDALIAAQNPVVAIAQNDGTGPILPIYSINFSALPAQIKDKTKDLIVALNGSSGAYDAGKQTSRSDGTIGAMRQMHSNNPKYLPDISAIAPSGRGKVYAAYVTANKGHTNDRAGDGGPTGYIEYTAGDSTVYPHAHLSEMRIVFDYLQGRVFLTPFHYQSWEMVGGDSLTVKDKPALGSGLHNPFFWIIEIKKKI